MEENVPKHVEIYTMERAQAFGKDGQELRQLIESFGLFLSGEVTVTPINDWIADEDIPLIAGDSRITEAQNYLHTQRKTKNENHAIDLSRSTEWVVLLEKFIQVTPVPDSTINAA